MDYPRGYVSYLKQLRAQGVTPDSRMAKFTSRYRFAGQLKNIELLGYSPAMTEIYLVVLRLCLAYSAFEQLEALVNRRNLPIKDPNLSMIFRSSKLTSFRKFLIDESRGLKKPLDKFVNSPNDSDLNSVVRALRHSMFHGNLTATRAGITNRHVFAFIDQLEKLVFKAMDDEFHKFLSSKKTPHSDLVN
mgnify:CR=1 FL=1